MKKILSLLAFLLAGASTFAQDWTAPVLDGSKEYRYSTAVNARLSTNLFPSSPNLVLGAFVNGECKGMASPDPTLSGDPFYMLDLRSDADADLNMPITFRVYDQGTGYEYVLNSPSSIKFIDEATYGNPPSTNAVQLSLTAATSFSLNFTEAELWTPEKPIEYNLKEYMTITPTGAQLPVNLTWEITPEGYAHATDTLLVALTLYDGPLTLNLKAPSLPTGGPGATLASSVFHIVQHATAIDLVQTTLTINKNDMESMMAFMQKDVAYKLNPTTSTDEVLWETENSDILRWDDTRKAFYPQAGGTTRMRPYILQNGGTKKLVPLAGGNDAWITVTVNVPVESITIDYSAFNGSFKANVGDEHLYERMAKMITILPADATDKTYKINIESGDGVVEKVGNTTFRAVGSGIASLKVEANGSPATAAVQNTISLIVEKPVKEATIPNNTIYTTLTDGNPTDITDKVKANITLGGDPTLWATQATATLSGTFVTCTDVSGAPATPSFDNTGLLGTYTAVAEGTATMTINLRWPNYDAWGVSSDELTYSTTQKQFDIVVQTLVSLVGFNVAVTNPVAGQTGTITLTPQPAGATFDPAEIYVTIFNQYEDGSATTNPWAAQLDVTTVSETTDAMIYSFTSTIPCFVNVTVSQADNLTGGETPLPINDPTSATSNSFTGFEIGWPLELGTGWQWRSNPCGFIATAELGSSFGTDDLTEIRTSNKLLFNDPNWGLYGTLTSTAGIQQGQTYKVNMKNAHTATLLASSVTSDEQRLGTTDPTDGSLAVTLKPGWNWVGSPFLFDRMLNNILVSVPTELEGAVIVGKTATAELQSGIWKGDLKVMKAGEGYIIQNPTSSNVVINFKNEMTDFQPGHETAPAGVKGIDSFDKVWEYDHSRFMNNMSIVGTLEGVEHPDQYSIGAFVGDECRGEGIIEDGKAFITVHCDAGEFVTFKLYSPYTRDFYTIEEGLQAETRVGSLRAPFKLHAAGVVDGINATAVASPSGEANAAFDLNGRRAITNQRGITIRRTADGKTRKVIVK